MWPIISVRFAVVRGKIHTKCLHFHKFAILPVGVFNTDRFMQSAKIKQLKTFQLKNAVYNSIVHKSIKKLKILAKIFKILP